MKTRQIVYGSDLDWLMVYEFTDRVYAPDFGEFKDMGLLLSKHEGRYNINVCEIHEDFTTFMKRMIAISDHIQLQLELWC